jgi:small subunit ribosomal protein S1
MSAELSPHDDPSSKSPPEIDEGYWSALLEEGEYAGGKRILYPDNGVWEGFEPGTDGLIGSNGVPFGSQHDWLLAQETHEADKSIELVVTGYNRGGLLVSWNSLRGFVPASQLVNFPVDIDEATRRVMLSRKIGQKIVLRIIELEVATNRLILSERAAQAQPGQRADILSTLEAGTVCEGVVTNLCDFGAFVDLGGIEGLIHISELSWGRVNHPRDVLSSGQHVRAFIMSVEPGEERIALSLKRLQPDPWQTVEQRYNVGEIVEGVVTNVVDFGAFACIEEGLEGLIHISELAEGQFLHPRNVVAEGERIQARILNIDGRARRLGLSLRHLSQEGEPYPSTIHNAENSSNSNNNRQGSQ